MIDKLAQRWGVHPSVIENGDPVWILRGEEFLNLEAQATPRHQRG